MRARTCITAGRGPQKHQEQLAYMNRYSIFYYYKYLGVCLPARDPDISDETIAGEGESDSHQMCEISELYILITSHRYVPS